MILYMRTLPSYDVKKGNGGEREQEHIDADDPTNKNKVEKLLFG